ncbi:MAG: hypothetical protein Q9O62_13450 [Ardenticatenia bacterium]|nr:hypothetical protein [Ardenticatenia bacterium]
MTLLRLIHVLSAIFWVGSTLFITFFLEPTVQALGAEGGRFMQRLTGGRLSPAMALAGLLTIASGLWMYASVSGGFDLGVMFAARLPLTLGALAGITSLLVGLLVQGRASRQLKALGQRLAAQGGPPTPEQAARLAALQHTLRRGGQLNVLLMILAVVGMVTG